VRGPRAFTASAQPTAERQSGSSALVCVVRRAVLQRRFVLGPRVLWHRRLGERRFGSLPRDEGLRSLMALSDSYLAWLQLDAERMATLDPALLATKVPTCPEWDVAGLIDHTAWVHRYWTYALGRPEGEVPRISSVAPRPDDVEIIGGFRASLAALVGALRDTPPSKSVSSGLGVRPASFVLRRVVHETAIHRWDAQAAVGEPDGFEPALAADGIDEMLEVWVPLAFDYAAFKGTGQRIHFHGTDVDGEWLITVNAETTQSRHVHEQADVTVRGRLSDLYLLSWNRVDPSRLDVAGDEELLTRWQAAATV
jgi:uncharacterized protein (TIGR03083 family)